MRPKLPDHQRRDVTRLTRMTKSEDALISAAAGRAGKSKSAYLRDAALAQASR